MVEDKGEKLLGHIGLDDYQASDGVSLIFSKDINEDDLFKGMFITIENQSERFLGQIMDEPKSVPVTGRTDNPLNEYPILHQDTIQYVPEYKKVSRVKVLGEINEEHVTANFVRPKPASKCYRTSQVLINKLFNVGTGHTLGKVIGYKDPWISVSFGDAVARKHLGIFGTTGSGKSNTTLRVAEMYANMGWCIFILDYLGEYTDCREPNYEERLFSDKRWADLGIKPEGLKDVEVLAPLTDTKSKRDTSFILRTMDVSPEVIYNLVTREEAQRRKLSNILNRLRKIKVPYHLRLIKEACYWQSKSGPVNLQSSYYVMEERIRGMISSQSLWDRYVPDSKLIGTVKQEFGKDKQKDDDYTDDVIDENPGLPDVQQSAFDTTISKVTGQSYKVEGGDSGIKYRLDIQRLLKSGKVNVFNFKNSSEEDYRSSTLYILSELFNLKKGAAENINSLPKVLILIEEAHIPFSNETENYLGDILMDVAKKIFKIGRHYYLNMCVVTQRPKDVDSALLSQINTRIIHRLKTNDDINRVIVGDIEEFKSSIPRLSVGEAMIDSVEWVTPLYIQAAPSKSKKIDLNYEKG